MVFLLISILSGFMAFLFPRPYHKRRAYGQYCRQFARIYLLYRSLLLFSLHLIVLSKIAPLWAQKLWIKF